MTESATVAPVPAVGVSHPAPAAGHSTRVLFTARERRDWIIDPSGKVTPGHYTITFRRNGPLVPISLSYGPPVDQETGEPLDRSPRWILKVGFQERHAFNTADLPSLTGEPITAGQYFDLLEGRAWEGPWSAVAETETLYR